jgi:hypothetical protein
MNTSELSIADLVCEFCRCVEKGIDHQTEDDLGLLQRHFDAAEGVELVGWMSERRDAAIANYLFQIQKRTRLAGVTAMAGDAGIGKRASI